MVKITWENNYTYKDYPKQWQGLDAKDFRQYRNFINRISPGICGTYASAALVHYVFQKERDYDLKMEQLLRVLEPVIDQQPWYKGTFAWDLTRGLNRLLKENGAYKARYHLISEPIVLTELIKRNPLPVIVGTTRLFGSKYGNHWLLVYAFGYNASGKLFYKAYDNHGRTQAIIPASQTLACIWLDTQNSATSTENIALE